MQKHTRIFMKHHGYGEQDFIPCSVCHSSARDLHHIHGRGKGKDVIENLIALCRTCHTKVHNNEISKEYLIKIKKP